MGGVSAQSLDVDQLTLKLFTTNRGEIRELIKTSFESSNVNHGFEPKTNQYRLP